MRWMALAFSTAAAACAFNPAPVPVIGPNPEIANLAGHWIGEYSSVETGRTGSITFQLEAGADSATGDVVMVPLSLTTGVPDDRNASASLRTTPQVLRISFVHVGSGTVNGTLDPYPSPDCGCTLTTTFRGTLRGDRIEGEFHTAHSDPTMAVQRGTWWVKRSGAPAVR